MRTVLAGGTVVTGDGSTVAPDAAVVLEDRLIVGVEHNVPDSWGPCHVMDVTGCVVMPGLINCHTHGVTPGPMFPSGARRLDDSTWLSHLDRHLLAGTTTVLSMCGFATMDEVREADRRHAVKVKGATTHFPSAIAAAMAVDGAGLNARHRSATVDQMLDEGALAIGEVGGGQTMGGGGQELHYLPQAFERATGLPVSSAHARSIKNAALGPHLDRDTFQPEAMRAALQQAGLTGLINPQRARDIVFTSVMPSYTHSLTAMADALALGAIHQVPTLVHSAAASAAVLSELAPTHGGQSLVIAGHSNHPSFTPEEAVEVARRLDAAGWLIEACTFDLLHIREAVPTRAHWDILFEQLPSVALLATDYGVEGMHDDLMAGVADLVTAGHRSLAQAVSLATARPAEAIPGIAEGGGRLLPRRVADIVVCRQTDLRDVRHVFVDGVHVVRDGRLTEAARR